jgi:hypothetical protein
MIVAQGDIKAMSYYYYYLCDRCMCTCVHNPIWFRYKVLGIAPSTWGLRGHSGSHPMYIDIFRGEMWPVVPG